MKVEQHITHALLLVLGEFEADFDGLGYKSEAVALFGLDNVGIVDESGRPDEHECQLFADVGDRDNFLDRSKPVFLSLLGYSTESYDCSVTSFITTFILVRH